MTITLSPVVNAELAGHGAHFAARRLDLQGLGSLALPVMGFDHYRMSGPTFAPHPHAGFSAVSYLFESSPGGLRNRDSLNNDVVINPGAVVWTQAGSGVVHDEFPAQVGREVHGVQLFINMGSANKSLEPAMFHSGASQIPVVADVSGNRTRVVVGRFSGAVSPIKPAEAFDLLDVEVSNRWTFDVPSNRNVLIYVVQGAVAVAAGGHDRDVGPNQAVAAQFKKGGELIVSADAGAQILVLSGTDPREPVAVYGPFIMNNEAQLAQAFDRYQRGYMGRLTPLGEQSN